MATLDVLVANPLIGGDVAPDSSPPASAPFVARFLGREVALLAMPVMGSIANTTVLGKRVRVEIDEVPDQVEAEPTRA